MAAISGAEVASRLAGYIDWLVHFLGIAKKKPSQPIYIKALQLEAENHT
jgi:hypothetical protein